MSELSPEALARDMDAFMDERAATQTKCTCCRLPDEVREVMRRARQREPPGSFDAIAAWLAKHRFAEVEGGTVRMHFIKGHEGEVK